MSPTRARILPASRLPIPCVCHRLPAGVLGRVCPGNHESAGRSRSGATRKGPRWLGIYLHDAAMGALRTKNTYLAAQYASRM